MPSLKNIRIELHGPGATVRRRAAPMASVVLDVPDTGQTDPTAIPTVSTLLGGGGFTGKAIAIVSVLNANVYCAIGKTPNANAEPRLLLTSFSSAGAPYEIEVSGDDRLAFALTPNGGF